MKVTRWCVVGVVAVGALGGAAMMGDGHDHPGEDSMAAAMSPEMMKAWMEYATPGPGQARLATRVGEWKCLVRHWASPDAPVDESWGESELSMMLGGRFLVQEYESHSHGMHFEGLGITGFNNKTQQYEFTWVDNMSTGLMQGAGTLEGDTLQLRVKMTDPMTGPADMWGSETFDNPDRFVSTMYMKDANGREFKVMEIIYEREDDDDHGHDHDHHGHDHHGHDHHGHDHD